MLTIYTTQTYSLAGIVFDTVDAHIEEKKVFVPDLHKHTSQWIILFFWSGRGSINHHLDHAHFLAESRAKYAVDS